MSVQALLGRRLRLGMVGGGAGSFIGEPHRIASRIGNRYELVAGCFSRDPERSRAVGRAAFVPGDRTHSDWRRMIAAEAARSDGVEVLCVATTPETHHAICTAALEAGLDVICDKPLTRTLAEGLDLAETVRRTGLVFGLTHNYTGYPMVREARALVRQGAIGAVRLVVGEFAHGAPGLVLEEADPAKKHWRFRPEIAGYASVLTEIGTHAHHMAGYVSGLVPDALAAELTTHAPGRQVADNAFIHLRYAGGARGTVWASYVAAGNEHGMNVRIFGETGSLAWRQEDPNYLVHTRLGEPPRRLSRGAPGRTPESLRATRVVLGHPEGFFDAFATLYDDIGDAVAARRTGTPPDPALDFPTIEDGVAGLRMIEAAVQSSRRDGAWVDPSAVG